MSRIKELEKNIEGLFEIFDILNDEQKKILEHYGNVIENESRKATAEEILEILKKYFLSTFYMTQEDIIKEIKRIGGVE